METFGSITTVDLSKLRKEERDHYKQLSQTEFRFPKDKAQEHAFRALVERRAARMTKGDGKLMFMAVPAGKKKKEPKS